MRMNEDDSEESIIKIKEIGCWGMMSREMDQ